jgi:hypothetical protein
MLARHALRGSIILRHCSQRPPLPRAFYSVLVVHHKTKPSPFQSCIRLISTPGQGKSDDSCPLRQLPASSSSNSDDSSTYHGPLANTFKKLKMFSLASLSLSIALAPVMFLVDSNLPVSGRVALASIAIGTSGISTALVGWCGKPYVKTLKRLKTGDGVEGLELITYNLFLRPRVTRVSCKRWVGSRIITLTTSTGVRSVLFDRNKTAFREMGTSAGASPST